MNIKEIIYQACLDDANKLSHSRIWSNIANLASTIIILYFAYQGTLSDDLLLFYMLILSGHSAASKLIKNKFSKIGGNDDSK